VSYYTRKPLQWVSKQFQLKKEYDILLKTSRIEKRNNDKDLWLKFFQIYVGRLEIEIKGLSPEEKIKVQQERISLMNLNNPKFILRNYIAQNAIELAEKGDYSEVKRLLKLLSDPYSEKEEFLFQKYVEKPPVSALKICVTCSS